MFILYSINLITELHEGIRQRGIINAAMGIEEIPALMTVSRTHFIIKVFCLFVCFKSLLESQRRTSRGWGGGGFGSPPFSVYIQVPPWNVTQPTQPLNIFGIRPWFFDTKPPFEGLNRNTQQLSVLQAECWTKEQSLLGFLRPRHELDSNTRPSNEKEGFTVLWNKSRNK